MVEFFVCMTAQNTQVRMTQQKKLFPSEKNNLYDLPSVIKNEGSYRHIRVERENAQYYSNLMLLQKTCSQMKTVTIYVASS